jgi:plastocyanin
MVRKEGSRNVKGIDYAASAIALSLVAIAVSAALPEAIAGGGGRKSGIIQECIGAQCNVAMEGSAFTPETLKIMPGATVVWTSAEMMPHTVTSGDSGDNIGLLFDSGSSPMTKGETFEHKFDIGGTFDYFCRIHPMMTGQIAVAGEPVQQFSQLTFMMLVAAGVFGTFAAVASIRLKKK